ncbi:unnamed protein product [Gulo gulo]|uniref:Uncharacterized protein n=1 Tax=Gulo gulo TaxID=48420 RepID=A0A9X9LV15_GULGU|nr:unnamed protein product [Gulo gulo]
MEDRRADVLLLVGVTWWWPQWERQTRAQKKGTSSSGGLDNRSHTGEKIVCFSNCEDNLMVLVMKAK